MTDLADLDALARAKTLLERLIAFPTVSDRSNRELVDYVADYLRGYGAEPLIVPNRDGDKAALFASFGPREDGGVVLSGHTDVVPVEGQRWTGDPFRMRASQARLYGRGACDMKGFDAATLAAAPAFANSRRPIHILLSYDEETTCLGSLGVIERFGKDLPRPALAIVGEPTSMAVANAHKGVAMFQTEVCGKEAHSAHPNWGANAISAAAAIIGEIDRLAREEEKRGDGDARFDPPYSTYHVGLIRGGSARNIVPRACVVGWEFRGLPGATAADALARVRDFVDRVALPRLREHHPEPAIETNLEVDVPGLAAEPSGKAAELARRLAGADASVAVPFATEAGHFQAAGMSTAVCGPGNIAQAHKPDEFVEEHQLAACLDFLHKLAGQDWS